MNFKHIKMLLVLSLSLILFMRISYSSSSEKLSCWQNSWHYDQYDEDDNSYTTCLYPHQKNGLAPNPDDCAANYWLFYYVEYSICLTGTINECYQVGKWYDYNSESFYISEKCKTPNSMIASSFSAPSQELCETTLRMKYDDTTDPDYPRCAPIDKNECYKAGLWYYNGYCKNADGDRENVPVTSEECESVNMVLDTTKYYMNCIEITAENCYKLEKWYENDKCTDIGTGAAPTKAMCESTLNMLYDNREEDVLCIANNDGNCYRIQKWWDKDNSLCVDAGTSGVTEPNESTCENINMILDQTVTPIVCIAMTQGNCFKQGKRWEAAQDENNKNRCTQYGGVSPTAENCEAINMIQKNLTQSDFDIKCIELNEANCYTVGKWWDNGNCIAAGTGGIAPTQEKCEIELNLIFDNTETYAKCLILLEDNCIKVQKWWDSTFGAEQCCTPGECGEQPRENSCYWLDDKQLLDITLQFPVCMPYTKNNCFKIGKWWDENVSQSCASKSYSNGIGPDQAICESFGLNYGVQTLSCQEKYNSECFTSGKWLSGWYCSEPGIGIGPHANSCLGLVYYDREKYAICLEVNENNCYKGGKWWYMDNCYAAGIGTGPDKNTCETFILKYDDNNGNGICVAPDNQFCYRIGKWWNDPVCDEPGNGVGPTEEMCITTLEILYDKFATNPTCLQITDNNCFRISKWFNENKCSEPGEGTGPDNETCVDTLSLLFDSEAAFPICLEINEQNCYKIGKWWNNEACDEPGNGTGPNEEMCKTTLQLIYEDSTVKPVCASINQITCYRIGKWFNEEAPEACAEPGEENAAGPNENMCVSELSLLYDSTSESPVCLAMVPNNCYKIAKWWDESACSTAGTGTAPTTEICTELTMIFDNSIGNGTCVEINKENCWKGGQWFKESSCSEPGNGEGPNQEDCVTTFEMLYDLNGGNAICISKNAKNCYKFGKWWEETEENCSTAGTGTGPSSSECTEISMIYDIFAEYPICLEINSENCYKNSKLWSTNQKQCIETGTTGIDDLSTPSQEFCETNNNMLYYNIGANTDYPICIQLSKNNCFKMSKSFIEESGCVDPGTLGAESPNKEICKTLFLIYDEIDENAICRLPENLDCFKMLKQYKNSECVEPATEGASTPSKTTCEDTFFLTFDETNKICAIPEDTYDCLRINRKYTFNGEEKLCKKFSQDSDCKEINPLLKLTDEANSCSIDSDSFTETEKLAVCLSFGHVLNENICVLQSGSNSCPQDTFKELNGLCIPLNDDSSCQSYNLVFSKAEEFCLYPLIDDCKTMQQGSTSVCEACDDGFTLSFDKQSCTSQGSGINKCIEFDDEQGSTCKTCALGNILTKDKKLCGAKIDKCSILLSGNVTKCDSCEEDSFLANDQLCYANIQNCKTMNTVKPEQCMTCEDEFLLTENKMICESEIANCAILDNDNQKLCHACQNSFILTENKKQCLEEIPNCETLDDNNSKVCIKCSGDYHLNYEYNYTAIFDYISASPNKDELMELLYFATTNSYALTALSNNDFKILVSNTIVLAKVKTLISVSSTSKSKINEVADSNTMNKLIKVNHQITLVDKFNEFYSLSQSTQCIKCGDGFYSNSIELTCQVCSKICKACSSFGESSCTSCYASFILQSSKCESQAEKQKEKLMNEDNVKEMKSNIENATSNDELLKQATQFANLFEKNTGSSTIDSESLTNDEQTEIKKKKEEIATKILDQMLNINTDTNTKISESDVESIINTATAINEITNDEPSLDILQKKVDIFKNENLIKNLKTTEALSTCIDLLAEFADQAMSKLTAATSPTTRRRFLEESTNEETNQYISALKDMKETLENVIKSMASNKKNKFQYADNKQGYYYIFTQQIDATNMGTAATFNKMLSLNNENFSNIELSDKAFNQIKLKAEELVMTKQILQTNKHLYITQSIFTIDQIQEAMNENDEQITQIISLNIYYEDAQKIVQKLEFALNSKLEENETEDTNWITFSIPLKNSDFIIDAKKEQLFCKFLNTTISTANKWVNDKTIRTNNQMEKNDYSSETKDQCVFQCQTKHFTDFTIVKGEQIVTSNHVKEDDNNDLTGGEIAGILIGSVSFLVIVGGLLYWFIIKKKSDKYDRYKDKEVIQTI